MTHKSDSTRRASGVPWLRAVLGVTGSLAAAVLVAQTTGTAAPVPPAPMSVPASAVMPPPAAATAATPLRSALDRAARHGNVLVGAQPSAADIGLLKPRGVTRVINLRTPEEMNDRAIVPFDEAALLAGAGVEYVQIPIGGNTYPFRPEALEAYARAIEGAKGDVFLHCTVGNRASTMQAAYEVKYRGKDPDVAMRELQPFGGWPLPIERLTGIELKVQRRASP